MVAAKRDEINDYVQIAREAKLKPLVVDIDAFTIQNLFEYTRGLPPDQTFAIINVGATQASINIISHGASAFTRDIANGGNYLTEQIVRQVGVPFEQAENLKCQAAHSQPGSGMPAQVFEVIDQVCETVAGELQRSLDFFLATSGEAQIDRVYLTGGTANLPQLASAIERRARVAVEVIQTMERIPVDGKYIDQAVLGVRASQSAVALGLAMRKSRERRL